MTDSVPYTERAIIQRAINNARPTNGCRHVERWVLVKGIFGTGQSVSRAICYKYGFDPDKIVSPIYPLPDDEGAR